MHVGGSREIVRLVSQFLPTFQCRVLGLQIALPVSHQWETLHHCLGVGCVCVQGWGGLKGLESDPGVLRSVLLAAVNYNPVFISIWVLLSHKATVLPQASLLTIGWLRMCKHECLWSHKRVNVYIQVTVIVFVSCDRWWDFLRWAVCLYLNYYCVNTKLKLCTPKPCLAITVACSCSCIYVWVVRCSTQGFNITKTAPVLLRQVCVYSD